MSIICLTPDIPSRFFTVRPAKCLSCPFSAKYPECWKDVVEITGPVQYSLGDGRILTISSGFCFDGASIPEPAWSIIGLHPYSHNIVAAALGHDGAYPSQRMERPEADSFLRGVMLSQGAPEAQANICYGAVRMFGSSSYHLTQEQIEYSQQFVTLCQEQP